MDETGLFYRIPADRALADRQMSKTWITLAFAANVDGID